MKAAYLLNNHIIFDSTRSELHVNQQVIVLQELENTLLTLFVNHPEEIISKEALFGAGWKGRYASDNSLNRVISTLRTKLGDNSKSPEFIKTIPKKGYCFIAPVATTEISDSDAADEQAEPEAPPESVTTTSSKSRILKPVVLLTIIGLLMAITSTIFLPSPPIVTTKISRVTPITKLAGNEIYPALSPSGQYIAFSHQADFDSFFGLLVKPLHGPSKRIISSQSFHALNPVWESSNKALLYIRSSQNHCEIRKAGISLQLELISDILITKCNVFNKPSSAVWGETDEVIYFTDIDTSENASYQNIYKYNLRSGKKTKVATPDSKKSDEGFYYVTYNKTNHHLIALSAKNKRSTVISVFDDKHKLIAKRLVRKELKQVTAYHAKVAFLTQNNQLNLLDPATGKENILLPPQATEIAYPFFNNESKTQLAFVSGSTRKSKLIKQAPNGVHQQVNAHLSAIEGSPVLDKNQALFYLSDRSGITQVWKKTPEGIDTQITQFSHSTPIYSLSISPNSKFLALDTQDGVQIFNLQTIHYQPTPLITLSGASTPMFSVSSQLLITKHLNGTNVLLTYDLKNEEYLTPLASDVLFGFKHPTTQKVFFTKRQSTGLWTIQGSKSEKVFEAVKMLNANMLQFTDEGFIFIDSDNQLQHYNIVAANSARIGIQGIQEPFSYHEQARELIFTQNKLGNTNIHLAELN